ncbi:MAG: hypothetical protein V4727_13195 [Verrucomicrobiota bacterium]
MKTIATLFFISAAALHYSNAEDISALKDQKQVAISSVESVQKLDAEKLNATVVSVFEGVPIGHPNQNYVVAFDPENQLEPSGHDLGSYKVYPIGQSGGPVTVVSSVYADNELQIRLVYQMQDENGKQFKVTKLFKAKTVKGVFPTKAELNTLPDGQKDPN